MPARPPSAAANGLGIITELLQLQCTMDACRHNVARWQEWAKRVLPSLWESSGRDAFVFCQRAHVAFTDESQTQFLEWRWDFLSALFDGKPCNCVCGTLFLLCAAEYMGLFPRDVCAFAGPSHIWVGARDRRGQWQFVETTLRQDSDRWVLAPDRARTMTIYGHGAWFRYTTAEAVIQEAFINQLLNAASKTPERASLVRMLMDWCKKAPADDLVLDMRQLYVRQTASRMGHPTRDQVTTIVSMISTIESDEDGRFEAYLKNIAFAAQWTTWALSHHDDAVLRDLQRRIWSLALAIERNLGQGQWSASGDYLKKQWNRLAEILQAWRRLEKGQGHGRRPHEGRRSMKRIS